MIDSAPQPAEGTAALCVLASSSGGNCSVVVYHDRGRRRAMLIDAGLSPRKTTKLLSTVGLGLHDVSDVLFTHLDNDHAHAGWRKPPRDFQATIRMDRRQLGRAERTGLLYHRCEPFGEDDGPIELSPGVSFSSVSLAHDDLGVAAFRFGFGLGDLGFATDLGRVTDRLIDELAGVDVIAIESNYCPAMQHASDRPDFLKRRIMDGSGHLSNEEAAHAVEQIAPREHAVFLHLSRDCNRPELVGSLYAGADHGYTIASPTEPTRWIPVRTGPARVSTRVEPHLFASVHHNRTAAS